MDVLVWSLLSLTALGAGAVSLVLRARAHREDLVLREALSHTVSSAAWLREYERPMVDAIARRRAQYTGAYQTLLLGSGLGEPVVDPPVVER